MERCKTCKWWANWKTVPTCDRIDHIDPIDIRFEITAQADDDSGLFAELLTGPEFGCVLHEPRTTKT